jgi:solute carrier family 38 (sodium-coupled neutral amino acid transporter), member 11
MPSRPPAVTPAAAAANQRTTLNGPTLGQHRRATSHGGGGGSPPSTPAAAAAGRAAAAPSTPTSTSTPRPPVTTLTLCILGSSVLPVPYAFSRAGLVPSLAILIAVSAANAYGCAALLRAGEATAGGGRATYESVARALGGPRLALATRCLLILLLWGTLAGDWALLAEVGPPALARLCGAAGPVVGPRTAAAGLAALTAPLCFAPRLRSLEAASTAGVGLVAALVAVVAGSATAAGWPGLRGPSPRGFPLLWPASPSALAEACAVCGFALYLAPLIFPVVAEAGTDATSSAVRTVVLAVAPIVYGGLGVAGPGRWGTATAPSLLQNEWLGGGRADGVLDAAVVLYLCLSIPPIAHALRQALEAAVVGGGEGGPPPPSRSRFVVLTCVAVFTPLAAALAAPERAEAMFA